MSLQYGEDAHGVAGAGLVSRIERGAGDQTASWRTLSYDDAYNVSESRSSYGERRTMTFDSWDRPVREIAGLSDGGPLAPVGSTDCGESAGAAMERAFDAAGHVVRERRLQDVVDPATGATLCRWQETRYRWNLREQLVGVEQSHLADPTTPGTITAAPRTVQERGYDEDGRLARVTQAALTHPDVVTTYRYDAAGRIAGGADRWRGRAAARLRHACLAWSCGPMAIHLSRVSGTAATTPGAALSTSRCRPARCGGPATIGPISRSKRRRSRRIR